METDKLAITGPAELIALIQARLREERLGFLCRAAQPGGLTIVLAGDSEVDRVALERPEAWVLTLEELWSALRFLRADRQAGA